MRFVIMRIFVTHICPKDRILEYGVSISASNFNYNLIDGGVFDKVYSVYPGFVRRRLDKVDDDSFEAVYSSWRWKGRLRGTLARFIEQWRIFRKIPRGARVWYYNMTTLNVLLIILLWLFKRSVQQNIIILDMTPDQTDNRMMLPLINLMHSRVSLSTYAGFKRKRFVCMPGVTPSTGNDHPRVEAPVAREFLLSGALNENIAMLSMVLDAFAEMPELELHVSGKLLAYKEKMADYNGRYANIHFHGVMPYDDFKAMLERVPFALNTRKPSAPENLCNFPSKVIEALLYNRVVVSTIHYPQLGGINYLEVGADKETFKADLRRIAAMTDDDLLARYANQGAATAERFNVERWAETMSRLEAE